MKNASAHSIPFVIGSWVCGPRFYGRQALLAEILAAPRRRRWFAGLRRIGKTSLLKQIDHLAASASIPILPLFWDLQGVEGEDDLGLTLTEALLDGEERLEELEIAWDGAEEHGARGSGPFARLMRLARAASEAGATLLLLCDEADALLALARRDPALPARLWQAAGAETGIVLASSLRLADLGMGEGPPEDRVAGLAEHFGAPTPLGVFAPEEARALLRQLHLPEASRPDLDAGEIETLRRRCGDHPMLLQIAAKRRLERGDLDSGWREVVHDPSIDHLFAVDFDLLAPGERRLLLALARKGGRSPAPAETQRLEALGLLRSGGESTPSIANPLFASWLARHAESLATA